MLFIPIFLPILLLAPESDFWITLIELNDRLLGIKISKFKSLDLYFWGRYSVLFNNFESQFFKRKVSEVVIVEEEKNLFSYLIVSIYNHLEFEGIIVSF